MERSYKSTELLPAEADKFKVFLRENGIKAESSGCYNLVHFEVYVNEQENKLCNNFLSNL